MLQNVMYVGLGFLTAVLFALMLAPFLLRRAVNKTTRLVRSRTPLTMAEIQADRDQLRAEYAVTLRKMEVQTNQTKEKLTRQTLEISTKMEEIGSLKKTIEQQAKQLDKKDTEILGLTEQLAALETELKARAHTLELKDTELAESKAGLVRHRKKHTGERIEPILAIATSDVRHRLETDVADMAREVSDLVAEIANISSQKLRFESQRTSLHRTEQKLLQMKSAPVKNIESTKIRISALEVERARLLADMTGLEQKTTQIRRRLKKAKPKWKGSANPYAEMIDKIDILSEQTATLAGQLAKTDEPDPPYLKTKTSSNGVTKPGKKTKTRPASAGNIPTLADRIRALQNEIAQ